MDEELQGREHRTMAALLLARGQDRGAAVVAASTYERLCVDNWDGGQYEVALGVPVILFDQIDAETSAALNAAAQDVIGKEHYAGISVQVQLMDPEPGWQQALLERVFGTPQHVAQSRAALPPGADSTTAAES